MRTIKYTTRFKRDYKREKKSVYRATLDDLLLPIIKKLAKDIALPLSNYDHPLTGQWFDHRDCHIKPDLILIYRKPDIKIIELIRLGSHSELGL